jgi:outer membrane protein OmpA-like peptidoglycan-associated protein
MKKALLIIGVLFLKISTQAQIIDPNAAVKNSATNHINSEINNGAEQGVNAAEQGIKNLFKKKPKEEKPAASGNSNSQNSAADQGGKPANSGNDNSNNQSSTQNNKGGGQLAEYGKFDFVPGDTVLFEDNIQDEQTDEIPSKWLVLEGQIEIRQLDGQNVIQFTDGGVASMQPRLKNPTKSLGKRWTLEYDVLLSPALAEDGMNVGVSVSFTNGSGDLNLPTHDGIRIDAAGNCYFQGKTGKYSLADETPLGKWVHVSIAANERSVKEYWNSQRVLNASIQDGSEANQQFVIYVSGAEGISKRSLKYAYFKNFRLAIGGKDPYKQITTDGKFIARGIKFDYNKATLKPESMGEINRINALMKEHPDLKFEIGGHTDSDGDAAYNLKLSQQRADAVKDQLTKLGIDASKLTTKGYGASKPMASNETPEGKANNRRVEFTVLK